MTDIALDCTTIAKLEDDHIFSMVQNYLFPRQGWKAHMTTEELFIFAWACYEGGRVSGAMTIARGEGDYRRWVSDRVLPCYMGSWFIQAQKEV